MTDERGVAAPAAGDPVVGAGARRWPLVAVLVLGVLTLLNLAAFGLERYLNEPGGPAGSSFSTGPDGLAAYADLLRAGGHPVSALREAPADAVLDPRATVVVIDPEGLAARDGHALRRFVERGGRLVAGGSEPDAWLEALLDRPPSWSRRGRARVRPLVPVPETADLELVAAAGVGSWRSAGGTLAALGEADRALLAVAALRAGRVALLADTSPLHNRRLAVADNAALGLALAGDRERPVLFAESVHGFGRAGLAALPLRWRLALAGLCAAALVLMASRARRLGPPPRPGRDLPPPRSDYACALAGALARTRRPGEAVEPVRIEARARLARRSGLEAEAGESELRLAAERAGLSGEEAEAVLGRVSDERGAIAAGRALARLPGGAR